MRRRRPAGPAIPERYARFQRSEWPAGLSCEDAVEFWHQARETWALANAYEWPEGYPTTPIGDFIDRLKDKREARMRACYADPPQAANGSR